MHKNVPLGDHMRAYIAGPLFCQAEREYNLKLKERLSEFSIEAILPQDSDMLFEAEKMGDSAYAAEAAKKIFERDLALLESCDVLVINLDGRVPDEGACVELGYAYAKGIPAYGIKTDVRVSEFGIDNMMIAGMLGDRIAHTPEDLAKMILRGPDDGIHVSQD